MKKYIQYTHPAACGYEGEGSYDYDAIVKELGLEKTKMLFTPINFKWSDLEFSNIKKDDKKIK